MDHLTHYRVIDPKMGDIDNMTNWQMVRADSVERAAGRYCEDRDRLTADYDYAKEGGCSSVLVRHPDGNCQNVSVRVVTTVDYVGTRIGAWLKPCFGACQIGCDPCTEPDCPNTAGLNTR